MPSSKSENAFDTLLGEIEDAINSVNQDGAKAFQNGNYGNAKALIEKGQAFSALAIQLAELRKQWHGLLEYEKSPQVELISTKEPKLKKAKITKMEKGLRTHEDAYRVPILQALVELGGSSNLNAVIDRVGEMMKPILNEYDYLPLKSDSKTLRWRNATQWVRLTLVKEGLMISDSPPGTWEISPKGRQWLKQQQPHP